MTNRGTPDDVLLHMLEVYKNFSNNQVQAANYLGLDRRTFGHRLRAAQLKLERGELRAEKPFEIPRLPDGSPDAEELLERRKKDFERTRAAKVARKLIPITVKADGPIGIVHFGEYRKGRCATHDHSRHRKPFLFESCSQGQHRIEQLAYGRLTLSQ